MYLLGVSAKTYKSITDKNRETDVAPSYSLLIRLLSKHQDLNVIPPKITMTEFAEFLYKKTGVIPRDHAAIMLGQTKTYYFKAIKSKEQDLPPAPMSPVAANLARMYMAKIEREGYEALDEIRKTVEIEAESRGFALPATIWRNGHWPRNIRGREPRHQVVNTNNKPIVSKDIEILLKYRMNMDLLPDCAHLFGSDPNAMITVLTKNTKPLELSATHALITRFRMESKDWNNPLIPKLKPDDIFDIFKRHGISPSDADLLLGIKPNSVEQMLRIGKVTPIISRLAFFIERGLSTQKHFLESYKEIINEEAMALGLEHNQIFKDGKWPRIKKKLRVYFP
jgi:hypothetical protein